VTQLVSATAASQSLVEAEYVLLASLMYDNARIDAVADILNPEDFAEAAFGHVYGLVVSEYAQGRPANIITIRPMIADMPAFSGAEGQRFWRDMATSSTLLMRPTDGAKMIAREACKRRLADGLREGIAKASDPQSSVESIADVADAAIVGALAPGQASTSLSIGDAFNNLANSLGQPANAIRCNRVPTLDKLTGGIRRKQLVVLAARPGMGKTAVALSLSLGTAMDGRGTLYVSLEMGAEELTARMMADLSFDDRRPIALSELLDEQVPQWIIDRTVAYGARISQFPLQIEDVAHMTIGRLAMVVRRHKRRLAAKGIPLEVVVVDYLQLLSGSRAHEGRVQEISEISRGLKAIAKENDVAVIAISQLNRDVEKRSDKRPNLADLRESGQIEQDADVVLFLLRDEYYLRQNEPAPKSAERVAWEQALSECENKLEIILGKHRQRPASHGVADFYAKFQAVRG
jgi:replicative DNA helicase